MWRYKPKFGALGWINAPDRYGWLRAIELELFVPKAPRAWVKQQWEQDGRPPVAAYSIWAKYPTARKLLVWTMASDEDAIAAGYLRE